MKRKPCPFCSGEVINDKYGVALKYLECESCGARTEYFRTIEEAEEAWNRREPMDRIVEQLEEIQMEKYSAKAEYVQGMNGISAAYCDGAISTIEKAIEIVKGGKK